MIDAQDPERQQPIILEVPLHCYVRNSKKYNYPVVEMRKTIGESELQKQLISAAFHGRSIIIQPTFTDKFRSLRTLQQMGLIYMKDNEYFFTFN